MLIHLRPRRPVVSLRILQVESIGPKIDLPNGVRESVHGPKNVRCSIFNEILPIRNWYFGDTNTRHLNNGHWLIRTQAWAISVKD